MHPHRKPCIPTYVAASLACRDLLQLEEVLKVQISSTFHVPVVLRAIID